jgi:CheY-like chemotaxis protein
MGVSQAEKPHALGIFSVGGTGIARGKRRPMPENPKPPRPAGETDAGVPLLDSVARRIEELSIAVVEQTERLLEKPDSARGGQGTDLATILDAARRSSELARELVALARRERDAAAAALLKVTSGAASERPLESEPAVSHRRVRGERKSEQVLVLVVEDEPLLLKAMCRMLEQYGHCVLAAPSSTEALGFAAREREIDLCVTDLALPGMPGTELVRRLRTTRPDLRVLYTSGWDRVSSGVSLRTDGSEAFLGKPFTSAELDACLTDLLGPSRFSLAQRG